MSRVKAELEKADEVYFESKKKHQEAFSPLKKTDLYKKYEETYNICKRAKNCKSCPNFSAADTALRNSEAYATFLPVDNEFTYADYRRFGLEKMVRYVRCNVSRTDIEAMRSGLHSALFVDANPGSPEREEIRDRVYSELSDFIKCEDCISRIESTEKAMPEYQ